MIKLGPDKQAAGTQIVVEAKEKDGYTLEAALSEIETARKNRRVHITILMTRA